VRAIWRSCMLAAKVLTGTSGKRLTKWYLKAAESGYAPAQGRLGQLYATGNGVPLDYVAAYAWYSSAAAGGYEPAKIAMSSLSRVMTCRQLQAAQARSLSEQTPRGRSDAVILEKKLPAQQWPQDR
jgi:TPR repeat protein